VKAKNRNVVGRTALVLGFDFRNECSVLRTRYIVFAVLEEEEEEEEEEDVFFFLFCCLAY
jgi:hypothetical protein